MPVNKRIGLREAIKFHGHLGPYLVLGILAGKLALNRLKAKKYFGLKVIVWGASEKPRSCLIDGLQLSTGATYGKGNIEKKQAGKIKILFHCPDKNKRLKVFLKEEVNKKLVSLKGHRDCEAYAKKIFKADPKSLFRLE